MKDEQIIRELREEVARLTDNLVERLRKNVMCGDAVIEEAADRIEKLEAVLRDLSDGWECCPVSQAMRRVARNALESDNG